MAYKLDIGRTLTSFDRKDREFLDKLDEQESKEVSPFMMIRWGSSVVANTDIQEYYLLSVNERLNKHHFDISSKDHKKLLWLLATTVSPDIGKQSYKWLGLKKKDTDNKAKNFLREIYPTYKESEIELLVNLNDRTNLKNLARAHGWTDERIKKEL